MVVNAQVVVADKISERRAKTESQKVVTKLLVVNAGLYCDTQVYIQTPRVAHDARPGKEAASFPISSSQN